MVPVSRILAATALSSAGAVALALSGLFVPAVAGPLMLGPGIVSGAALGNRWTPTFHVLTALLSTFLAAAAAGFVTSAPALGIAIVWILMFILALLLVIPFRLVRGARGRVAPEPTTRAQRRRLQSKVQNPKSKAA
jgi:hypothetical protein